MKQEFEEDSIKRQILAGWSHKMFYMVWNGWEEGFLLIVSSFKCSATFVLLYSYCGRVHYLAIAGLCDRKTAPEDKHHSCSMSLCETSNTGVYILIGRRPWPHG